MEEQEFINQRKAELQVEAQKMKDRLIDNFIRMFEEFKVDWNDVMGKMNNLNQKETDSDKLNK